MRQLMGGASVAAVALGAQGAQAQVESGSQHTVVTPGAGGVTVTTNNVHAASKTAFNRFAKFNVQQNTTTTLILPTATQNLVNVVAGNVQIDGAVVSRMQASNAVGGNLFFITSGGFLVGASGSINTGRLIVRGPSGALKSLTNPTGLPDTDALYGSSAAYDPKSLLDHDAASSITINGLVNAPGGIDLKGTAVTIGDAAALKTGAAGVAAISGQAETVLVNIEGLERGTDLVKINGGIAIVGEKSVTVEGAARTAGQPATLDARPGEVGMGAIRTQLAGGIDIASSGDIRLGGTLTAWDGTTAGKAANIAIAAKKTVTLDDTVLEQFLGGAVGGVTAALIHDFVGLSSAKTSVSLTGALSGANVTVASESSATTKPGTMTLKSGMGTLAARGISKAISATGSAFDVFYSHAEATSSITVAGGSTIKARNDLTVGAKSVGDVQGSASAAVKGTKSTSVAIAVGLAELNATATVTVDGTLDAGNALSVSAQNKATSKLQVRAISQEEAKAGAVAYTEADVDATLAIGATALLDGKTVTLRAVNDQGEDGAFVNAASVTAKDGSVGGGTAAVADFSIGATLTMAGQIGTVTKPNSVTIDAKTLTTQIANTASASTGSGDVTDFKDFVGFADDTGSLLKNALGRFGKAAFELLKDTDPSKEPAPEKKDGGDTTRLGAAVTVLFDDQRASATVSGTIKAAGAVAVSSLVRDITVRNTAKASVAAERKKDGEATSIAGAASWADVDYRSHAVVGGTIESGGLAVNAGTERQRGGEYDIDLPDLDTATKSDVTAFFKDVKDKVGTTLGLEKGFFANSAGATASTDSAKNAAISGSVSYNKIDADTRAWINPLAQVTLTGALAVKADSSLVQLNLSGALPVKNGTGNAGFGTAGGNAAGITVAYSEINPNTVAGIGKGAVIATKAGTAAVNADVTAKSVVNSFTIAPQSGKANAKTGSGTFGTNQIGGETLAIVSKDARLDLGTGKFTLGALTELEIWAVGGSIAVTKADGSGDSETVGGVGVSGALNLVDFDTRAIVGDAGAKDGSGAATAAAAANRGVTAEDVTTSASTTGSINAISVAGVATDTTPKAKAKAPTDDEAETEQAEESHGITTKARALLELAGEDFADPLLEAAEDFEELRDEVTDKVEGAQAAAGQEENKGKTPNKGFGVAGSASVNLSDLTTRVETTGASFTRAAGAQAADAAFVARAVEAVDMLSVTGGAAITTGSAKLKDGNTLISGAYGLSWSTNATAAALADTTVAGFGNVNVEAAANGSRIGAGLALSADTTKSDKGATFAASVSHLHARDGAAATVTGGSITGGGAAGGKVSILAYNGLTMGAGAGGLSWGAQNAFGGAATVVDIGSPDGGAANARLVSTPVSGFADLSVRALTAARVAGIAAAGAVNIAGDDKKVALTVGLSINLVSLDANALIDTGATGTGAITVGGAVNVFAGDWDGTAANRDPLASAGRSSSTAGAGFFDKFKFGATDFAGDDPLRASDLDGGTQILSVAIPVSVSRGKALGVGFAWNAIDNDRTAGIVGGSAGGSATTISAGSVSVRTADHSDILALGVGVGASKDGAGLMGSVSRNLIEGSSAAGIGRSAGATNNLVIDITGAPGATPNLQVGSEADGGIFSLAGAVGVGKKAAGGIAVGVNDITRDSAVAAAGLAGDASNAGLYAKLDGVSLKGNADTELSAVSKGTIVGNAIAIAAGQGASVAGAATVNTLKPTIQAAASRLTYLNASAGDLAIHASDASRITSTALVAGISTSKAGVAAGVSVNRIDADVSASLKIAGGEAIQVRTLLVEGISSAGIKAFGLGAGGGSKFGGAGSIAVNLIDSDTTALVDVTSGGAVTATGSVGVVAQRDATIDVLAGALALSAQGGAIGASVIVNDLGGSTDAQVTGAGTVSAWTGSGDAPERTLTGLRTGALTAPLPQFDALDGFKDLALAGMVKSDTGNAKGVAVNASSTAAVRTLAVTGGITGSGPAIAVTGVVDNVTSSTNAAITGTTVNVGVGTAPQAGIGVDVRASSQQVGMTFAGALAGTGGGVAAAAPVISDGYSGKTTATIDGVAITSTGGVSVKAIGNQSSTALAAAGAVASSVGVAVAGVSPRFQSVTEATIKNVSALTASGPDGVAVNADSSAKALATFVTLAGGASGAGAGAVVVATNENRTRASYNGLTGADGLGSVRVNAPIISIIANGVFDATVAGASAAASAGVSLVGNGVGVVHRGEVTATGDALRYGDPYGSGGAKTTDATGAVTVKATESVTIAPAIGQVAIAAAPTGVGASLGVIAILGQSKVDATLSRPTVAANTVDVIATGYNQINATELGVAVAGVGIGANVAYIGIGKVSETGALYASAGDASSDQKVAGSTGSSNGRNANMDQLQSGGSRDGSFIAGQTDGTTSTADRSKAAGSSGARAAFTENAATTAGDTSASRVLAQVTGGTGTGQAGVFAKTKLTIDSDANLLSKSTNIQATAGIAAGSATVGITRNAAESKARLGAVESWGGTLSVTATTGEAKDANARTLINAPAYAAENVIYAGSVGGGVLSVGVADVKLESKATAQSDGSIAFNTASITAEDTTRARTYAVGAAAGAAAANVVVSKATKNGTVEAGVSRAATVPTLDILATGKGAVSATAYAGSGGLIFAGNAAVALASDTRTIRAVIGENSTINALNGITLKATSTPLVDATSFGIAVSGSVAAGASIATAKSNGVVSALVGEGGAVRGTLNVTAETVKPASGTNVYANAIGSAGGLLAAVNGSIALAETTLTTNAAIGVDLNGSAGAALRQVGTLNIQASRTIAQYAEATGVTAAGVLAVGIQRAEANSDGQTRAAIENVDGSLRYFDMVGTVAVGGELQAVAERFYDAATVASNVLDQNRAKVTAGAGGLGAGIAADAVTRSNGSALTEILTPALPGAASASDTNKFMAGKLTVTATAAADYRAESDSTLATLAGGSGTTSTNHVGANARTVIGRAPASSTPDKGSYVAGTDIRIRADAVLVEGNGGSATGAGGGVVTGQAAAVKNHVNQTATVDLTNGLTLRQYGGDVSQNATATLIDAAVKQAHSHSAALDVGGVMQLPFAQVSGDYRGTTRVNIGRNVLIRGDQGVGIGTATQQKFADTVAVQIYGLAGLGGGKVDSTSRADGQIAIGNGTVIESLGDVSVTAGSAANGQGGDVYNLVAQTDTFNNTILPLDSEASAYANVHGDNRLIIGDDAATAAATPAVARHAFQGETADAQGKTTAALIRSARDITVEARSGAATPSAEGTGHNPYLKLFSLTTKSGSTSSDTKNAMTLNGANLVAGFLNDRQITIETANGASTRDGVAIGGTGYAITTNDALYHAPGDTDWLGRFAVTQSSYNAYATIKDQIAAKKDEAQALGIAIPIDPADHADAAANPQGLTQQQLRNALNQAAVKSDVIAQLSAMYETKAALFRTAQEQNQIDSATGEPKGHSAVVIGGALTPTSKLSRSGTFVGTGADTLSPYQIYTDRVGAVFAAGGRVTLGADAIGGTGKVTALGAPKVTVTNNTGADTVLGNIYMPFKVNGAIEFAGSARTLPGGIVPSANTSAADPLIFVQTGRARSDIVTLGAIANIAGTFRAKTLAGNYVQFGTVNVANFSADVPNGLFTVSTPDDSYSQGAPLSYWYGLPGTLALYPTNPGGVSRPGLGAQDAIDALASYVATVRLGTQGLSGNGNQLALAKQTFRNIFGYDVEGGDLLRSLFLDDHSHHSNAYGGQGQTHQGSDGPDWTHPAGTTLWGSCRVATCEFYSPDQAMGSSNFAFDNIGGVRVFNGNSDSIFDDDTIWTPIPRYHDTVVLRNRTQTVVTDMSKLPTIKATQVIINAANVDVSGVIEAGPVKERTLTINNTVGSAGGPTSIGYALAQGSASTIDLISGVASFGALVGSDSKNLGAQFVRTGVVNGLATGFIRVDDVVAGGGGSISITGKILNSSPIGGGMLKVLNGYGTINIDNQTGYEMKIGTVNAGLSADGIIKITDTWSNTIYEYTNSLNGQVKLNVTDLNGSREVGVGYNAGLVGGPRLDYQPSGDGQFYYVWNDSISLARTLSDTGASGRRVGDEVTQYTVSPWAKTGAGAAPDGTNGRYVNLAARETKVVEGVNRERNPACDSIFFCGFDDDGVEIPRFIETPFRYEYEDFVDNDAGRLNRALSGNGSAYVSTGRKDDFVQVLDGAVSRVQTYLYNDSDDGDDGAFIEVPLAATINIVSAAKATHPIQILFDQGKEGGAINIRSNNGGQVTLTGAVTFGGGRTSIETSGAIVTEKDGVVVARDISLTAGSSIGTIGTVADPTRENPFQASLMGGSISAFSRNGDVNLRLSSAATEGDKSAPIYVDTVRAAGAVKIAADTSLIGNTTGLGVISDAGGVTLDVTGAVVGRGYVPGSLTSPALKIGMRDDQMLTIRASGDVAIEQGAQNGAVNGIVRTDTSVNRTLRIGDISTPGDVTIKAYGSIVAGDPTATVDEAKLSRFRAAAAALQLDPACKSSCGIVDPASLGLLDQRYRDKGYALVDKLNTGTGAEQTAAAAELNQMFGFVPASREAIATVTIDRAKLMAFESANPVSRTDKIEFQLRNQAEAAYERYALTNADATAEDSRGRAVTATVKVIDELTLLGRKAQTGIALSADGRTVSVTDGTAAAFAAGDPLYTLAVSTLAANGKAPAMGAKASTAELTEGLQLHVDTLAAPVTAFGTKLTAVAGAALGSNGAITLTDAAAAALAPGAELYDTALAALRKAGTAPAAGSPLTKAQLESGLKLHRDALVAPVTSFAGTLTNGIVLGADFKVEVPDTAADQLNAGGGLRQLALTTLIAQGRAPAPGVAVTTAQLQEGLQLHLNGLGDTVDSFRAKFAPGITLSLDGRTVTVTNANAFALTQGSELYQLAVTTLAAKGQPVAGATATATELQNGLQLYLNDLRAPVEGLLQMTIDDLVGLDAATKATTVSQRINGAALITWVKAQNLETQRGRAATDALGRIEQIQAFGAKPGLSLTADGKTVTISDAAFAANRDLQPGGALYELGLTTLRAQVNPNGLRETVPLPTNDDVRLGLQRYLNSLRAPLLDLLPGTLPTLAAGLSNTDKLDAVSRSITSAALDVWAGKQQADAVAELTGLFGTVTFNRATIESGKLVNLDQRASGSTWTATQLAVSLPSTAFVPVADSQFETRKAVITAQNVNLLAGNSVGAFDPQLTFTYGTGGFVDARDANGVRYQRFVTGSNGAQTDITNELAQAYLASAGPGDLTTAITFKNPGAPPKDLEATEIKVTTRRDQPLQINALGTVNAVAAVNFVNSTPTATGVGSAVQGDIFISNENRLVVGSIISAKPTVASTLEVKGCNTGAAAAWLCDSRIRLVAPDIIGAAPGIAGINPATAITVSHGGTSRLLSNADGSGVVMGGLVRLEASNGSIRSASGGSLLVDTRAVEVMRAAGDAALERRSAVAIPTAIGAFNFGNDLRIGDVFAGERLQLDNRYGSLFVIGMPSEIESEDRNTRIVANRLAIRAAGDIGAPGKTTAGLPAQFDIQAPIITQFVAGYDYATGLPGLLNQQPAGLPAGDGYFALRGVSQIGSKDIAGSILGARRNITIGTLNNDKDSATPIKSSVVFRSDILVGGRLILTTDGDVSFPDPDVRITGLGNLTNPNYDPAKVVDLSALELNLKGEFNYFQNTRSIILGSLTAGGGVVESKSGFVRVDGTLYGNGGPQTPFTIKAATDVTVGSTGLGAIALLACGGVIANCTSDVTVTGRAHASDLTIVGQDISIAGGLFGRTANLTAADTGTVSIGGSVLLQRDTIRPNERSVFNLTGGDLTLSSLISAQDAVTVRGKSITGAPRTTFLNTGALTLEATGALNLDPTISIVNVGSTTLRSGTAAAGGSAVTIGSVSGGSLLIDAPVGITIGGASLSGDLSLTSQGAVALNGTVVADGAVKVAGRSIDFGALSQGVRDSSVLELTAAEMITTAPSTNLRTRGLLTVSARDTLTLAAVRANGGSITIGAGDLVINNGLISDGQDFRVQASGAVRFQAPTVLAGSMTATAGGDLLFNGTTTLTGPSRASALTLTAGGEARLNAGITASSPSAAVRIIANTVTVDPAAAIHGASVTVRATGSAVMGDVLANRATGQVVSLRAGGALSAGFITGGTALVTAAGGMATLRSQAIVDDLTVTARDDISTNGVSATSASFNSSTGAVTLGGTTRVLGTMQGAADATLTVNAAKGIMLAGATSAAGGMALTGKVIATGPAGFITDADAPGALTTLRADKVNVQFDTGQTAGPAVRIDARGFSQSAVDDLTLRLATSRPVQFDALWVNKGAIAAQSALTYLSQQVRDYLTVTGTDTGSVAPTPTPTPTPAPTPTPPPSTRIRTR